jgi:hypothetical protein
MTAAAIAARTLLRTQPTRSQPIRLPSTPGYSGALVEDATIEQLEACARQDRLWLYGGAAADEEGAPREAVGFLGDVGKNPQRHETVTEWLAHADERSADFRTVSRVHTRLVVVEAELAERAHTAAQVAAERGDARAKLAAWHATVPATIAAFQASAEQAAVDAALIMPIVAALGRLQAAFPNPNGALPEAYARLRVQEAEIASVLAQPSHEFAELPPLPSMEDVRHAVSALRTLWPEGGVPKSGLEKINLTRTLAEARGGDEF